MVTRFCKNTRWRFLESSSDKIEQREAENSILSADLLDQILWWLLDNFGLSISVTILRCISEPSFMFVTHFLEKNLCYFTQTRFLGGGSGDSGDGWWHCNYRVSSRSRPWDFRWSWVWDHLEMTWTLGCSRMVCLWAGNYFFCSKYDSRHVCQISIDNTSYSASNQPLFISLHFPRFIILAGWFWSRDV